MDGELDPGIDVQTLWNLANAFKRCTSGTVENNHFAMYRALQVVPTCGAADEVGNAFKCGRGMRLIEDNRNLPLSKIDEKENAQKCCECEDSYAALVVDGHGST